jgi:hypothetical protein
MTRLLILLFAFFCFAACRYNPSGYLQEEPSASELVGSYNLDLNKSQERLRRMGYRNFTGQITLNSDGSFTAADIPACCVHGYDESAYPFSGGHYSLSGTWKVAKSSAVYVVSLTLSATKMIEPPAATDPDVLKVDRKAPAALELNLIEGHPLSLGFTIFNGDFDDIEFSKSRK